MNSDEIKRLSIKLPRIELRHPVMNASGILGYTYEHLLRMREWGLAAIVTKTFTAKGREGYETPIIIELPSGGYLNAVGLANPGKDALYDLIPQAKELGLPIIVSVGGSSEKEFVDVAVAAEESGADAIELNLSCPHTKGYGIDIGSDPGNVKSVVREVVGAVKIPVYAKLGLSDKLINSCEAALSEGASCLTLINTIKATYIDVYTLKPVLTNIVGGLSGSPLHPIAIRVVYEVYKEFEACIIGVGGVYDWRSAAEFIAAGARAVQVGTLLALKGRELVEEILRGLLKWLDIHQAKRLSDLVGAAVKQ